MAAVPLSVQTSKLGGRVHRQVDEILRASDGAREVARELLGGTVTTLERILFRLDGAGTTDADALGCLVSCSEQRQGGSGPGG